MKEKGRGSLKMEQVQGNSKSQVNMKGKEKEWEGWSEVLKGAEK